MGYRIEYDTGKKTYEIRKQNRVSFPVLLGACFCLFLLLTVSFWPEGAEKLRSLLIPGDPEITVSSLEQMCAELGNGVPIAEAVTTFCRNVIYAGQAPN